MYGYCELTRDIKELGANAVSIGRSGLGREIFALHVGSSGGIQLIICGGIHARECVTAALVLRQAEFMLSCGERRFGAWLVPLLNPDGAEIVCGRERAPEWFSGNARLWKADAFGVDLNVNFDARWGSGKSNAFYRGSENYVGESPFSQAETRAIRDFTLAVMPSGTVSYHSKGRELYYDFFQSEPMMRRDGRIAELINERLGYKTVTGLKSAGGYKDWCISRLGIPAFTVEIGDDGAAHPLSLTDIEEDIRRNIDLPYRLYDAIGKSEIYESGD